ncbi:hypothetical protein BBF96_12610 [Anoxybacter fermentans]|uniref:GGDEF domain-containing protein n=1 Tax=Anoxybacter fermentans TaxID=1323375 RepID=A0A3S9T161_9FIRM|nr:GGDEF domain-containing protein [Anoxybacter fermentans]AZR74162.1 hypothetical protein BBF96_12610 [Anoxybacter fermentans]
MDKLTGLLDKETFFEKAAAYDGTYAIVDLDNFKSFNDAYGRDVGDEVLKKTAEVLKQNIDERHLIGRLLHDKFLVFFKGLNVNEAKVLLDDIREHFHGFYFPSVKKELHIIFSAGVGSDFETAERALKQAKDLGRNKIVCL